MKLLRYVLLPFVPVYYLITSLRNLSYDLGILHSRRFDLPIICVGNLSVGGTGKSPMVEHLIRLLKADHHVATLSRGYRRKTKGFALADHQSSALSIGDEPFQFYRKFRPDIMVAVDSDRQNGIQKLLGIQDPPDVIILDDAFQHRKVQAGFYILLSTYDQLYTDDWMLPTGDLRESRSGADRADIIVITKCPDDMNQLDKDRIIRKIKPLEHQKVFFSQINYSDKLYSAHESKDLIDVDDFTLVSGIANARPLVDFLKNKGLNFDHLEFKDHHNYTEKDILDLSDKSIIVTTEKDYVRLQQQKVLENKLYYLPITLELDRSEEFQSLIRGFVKT